jgi:16S rRNA C967 or C1407 C5-methylase (RsmB/RsmF family)/NOL1/NOP2/fmu family ribosome biogenesis protein
LRFKFCVILPDELLCSLEGLPGFDRAAFEAVHEAGAGVTSLRVNRIKGGCVPAGGERVPWSTSGYYLSERPSFTLDPSFHAGAYYVQEASSMFLEEVLRQAADLSKPLRVLDLCAAPGGKSTLLQSCLSADSLLVSNEVIRNRVKILQENMIKWGGVNSVVTGNDPKDMGRLENFFDIIVVDAPCSGSGLFRREPEAIGEWSPDNVRLCYQRQRRILADCWPALRRDGLLIYSTCSYSREENEDILDWILEDLGGEGCRLTVPAEWGIVESKSRRGAYGYRFYPDRVRGEGLFMAGVRKSGGSAFVASRKKGGLGRPGRKELEQLGGWVRPDSGVVFFRHGEFIHALPEGLLADVAVLQSCCYLRRAGVSLGKLAVKEFIPEHDLAMSGLASADLPVRLLGREQALAYLRKDELEGDAAYRGWTLVAYGGLNLGWIKALPGRVNNYYPKEWRILRRER